MLSFSVKFKHLTSQLQTNKNSPDSDKVNLENIGEYVGSKTFWVLEPIEKYKLTLN